MKYTAKGTSDKIVAILVCLFWLFFHTGISLAMGSRSDFSNMKLRSDTSEFVAVSGVVVDEKGEALSDVGVNIAGTYRNGRLTQSDGSFEIMVPSNQTFYLYVQHINYLRMSVPINSEKDIQGLKIELKELVCHLDLNKEEVTGPTDEFKHDLPVPVFRKSDVEQMEVLISLNRAEMPGGSFFYLPRFNRQKKAILDEMGALSKELVGHFQGTFVVDIDGFVKKITLEGDSNNEAVDVIEKIFQRTGKWAPAKNYGRRVMSKFSFSVDLP